LKEHLIQSARASEVQTLTNHNKAIVALQLAISSTLTDSSIHIQSGKDQPVLER
jgi:hypothetical protein